MFDSSVYVQRRNVLKQNVNQGIILFLGNDESPRNLSENPYLFRQHSSFLYYWGIDRPALSAIIDVDNDKEILFGDDPTVDELVMSGPQPTVAEMCQWCGVEESLPVVKLYTILREANAAGRNIHFLPPYRPENKIKLLRLLNIRPDQFMAKFSEDLVSKVVMQREIKSELEIAEMEKAVNLSIDMHEYAMRTVKPGMTEIQVVADMIHVARSCGSQLAFEPIATMHGEYMLNRHTNNVLCEDRMFQLDAGAESLMHYAGDISSSFPVSSTFTSKQREIYQIVLDAHRVAVASMKPGVEFRQVHFNACKTIFEGLKQLGLTCGDTEEAVAEGAHALFFPCGLGHMIGLDVRDMEDLGELNVGYKDEAKSPLFGLRSLKLAKELKPGFTVAIEPGVYFIPELINLWKSEDKFSNFINYKKVEEYIDFGGIRNEEDFLITDNGCHLLGRQKPLEIKDVEDTRRTAF